MTSQTIKPLALIGENSKHFIAQGLKDNGFEVITLPADNRLAPPVSSHADMLLLALDDTIFSNSVYVEKNKAVFNIITEYGYKIVCSDFDVSNEYPNDVALNQAVIGKNILGRKKSCATDILDYTALHGYSYKSIKQGYAKCSTLILNEKAIISADTSIIDVANSIGIKTLKINNGINEITLDGYDYGFIGGASTVYDSKVFFFGNLNLHSQATQIIDFCKSNNSLPISLGAERLCDIGGAIILPYINTSIGN